MIGCCDCIPPVTLLVSGLRQSDVKTCDKVLFSIKIPFPGQTAGNLRVVPFVPSAGAITVFLIKSSPFRYKILCKSLKYLLTFCAGVTLASNVTFQGSLRYKCPFWLGIRFLSTTTFGLIRYFSPFHNCSQETLHGIFMVLWKWAHLIKFNYAQSNEILYLPISYWTALRFFKPCD